MYFVIEQSDLFKNSSTFRIYSFKIGFRTSEEDTKIENLENLSENLTMAARHALLQMIDYIVREHGLTKEQAYILCSVAVDLRVGQVVDVPNYVITAVLNLDVFNKYRN